MSNNQNYEVLVLGSGVSAKIDGLDFGGSWLSHGTRRTKCSRRGMPQCCVSSQQEHHPFRQGRLARESR